MTKPEQDRNALLGQHVVAALKSRHFDAYWCPDKAHALHTALSLIPPGSSVTWGGCLSAEQIGLIDTVKTGPYQVYDRNTVLPKERAAFMREHFFSDVFLTGANAISYDGTLVNMDGTGNRVAAMIYGPGTVLVIAGINKLVPAPEDAITRTRNIAAPINAQRFGLSTPCSRTGVCGNCKCEDSICSALTVLRLCRPAGRIKVILVNENLGF